LDEYACLESPRLLFAVQFEQDKFLSNQAKLTKIKDDEHIKLLKPISLTICDYLFKIQVLAHFLIQIAKGAKYYSCF